MTNILMTKVHFFIQKDMLDNFTQTFQSPLQRGKAMAVSQAKRRLYSGMEPVFVRCCCYIGNRYRQMGKLRVCNGFAARDIPTQPRGAKFGQGASVWRVIDRKPVQFHCRRLSIVCLIALN